MDSGHSNEARWPNNTLLTYTLPRTVKVRKSVDVVFWCRLYERSSRGATPNENAHVMLFSPE